MKPPKRMVSKISYFDFDWWIIQKRALHVTVLILVLCAVAAAAGLYVWKYGNPLRRVSMINEAAPGARFISFEGDVRIIRSATRQVVPASSDAQLYPGDTVQTQADGRARITMADGSTVVVRPNSTIIIRDNAGGEDGKRSNVRVVVDSGQMLVRTPQQGEEARNVVETPKTQNQIASQTAASFGVNPEGTEEIRVNAGIVDSFNRTGERASLHSGEYVSINQSGTISKPQRLLDAPQPLQPRDLEKISVGSSGSASVTLRWEKPQTGVPAYYRVDLATSPFFVPDGKVMERDQLAATQFSASDLRPGAYFWRIRATAASGQTSEWCEPQKFIVMAPGTSATAIPLSNLTTIYLGGNIYIIRGKTTPAATVRISNRESIAATDGMFQLQITAPPSSREVTVQLSDSQGNNSRYQVHLN